ncbi:MAG: efflux RND transporter periplasmic adaptor subunit [Pseudomonadales bacterium]|nr:efflux RND transporter periplasmic adaptor subunit [Pseudomonadales bacterium]
MLNLLKTRFAGFVILIGAVFVAFVVMATAPSSEPSIVQEKAWPVSTKRLDYRSLSPLLVAYGKVESKQVAHLTTSIEAPVEEVFTHEGEWVSKDDVLIQLDNSELKLSLIVAQADYDRQAAIYASTSNDFALAQELTEHYVSLKKVADAKLQRHMDLYNSNMVSNSIVDEVQQQASEQAILVAEHHSKIRNFPNNLKIQDAMLAEKKAILDRAKLDLAQTSIRAPFDGRVIRTMVSAGDRVLPGLQMISVAEHDGIEVRAAISSKVGKQLRQKIRQGVVITALAVVDEVEVQLRLARLYGDVKSGQSGVDAFFTPTFGENLDIGRVVSLSITLPSEDAVAALPVQAIYGSNRVYRVTDNRLESVQVAQVGDYVDAAGQFRVLVRSETLNQDDVVVTTQLSRATSGLLVETIGEASLDQALAIEIEG